MLKSSRAFSSLLVIAGILLSTLPSRAQQGGTSSNVPVTTVVTVLGPKYTPPPAIGKDDISVYEGKAKNEVTGWVPAQGDRANLELAILIDDADSVDLGIQFGDIKNFIMSQSKTTRVGIFYASNGTVQPASQFNSDHEAVAKALRMPFGYTGAYSSLYLSIMDLISRWPVTGARREMLVIADGIDRLRGDPFSPDVDSAVARAQRAGIMIHTLYATGVGRFSRSFTHVSWGQSNLTKVSDGTGGESFFQGLQTPISFAPFLEQLDMVLKNQYWLTFATSRSKKAKGELRSFRVRTEQRNVEISSADKFFVPGP
jgi:hypothetical protein